MPACFGCSIRETHNHQKHVGMICTARTLSGMVYSRFVCMLKVPKPLRLPCT